MRPRRRRCIKRKGSAIIEFAAVAPVLFLLMFASIEFGRALMAVQSLEEAARSGCRVAILRGATSAEVEAEVDRILGPTGIGTRTVDTQPTNVAQAPRWSPVTVAVSAAFDSMSWLPLPRYLEGKTYTAECSLPKEYSAGG